MARKQAVSKQSKYSDLKTWNEKGQLKEGDSIDGYYIDKEVFTSKYGEGVIFILLLNDGKMIKVMGQTDIKNKMEDVPEKSHVWIKFAGLVETSKGAKKSYEIEYDDEDVIKEM